MKVDEFKGKIRAIPNTEIAENIENSRKQQQKRQRQRERVGALVSGGEGQWKERLLRESDNENGK